MNPCQWEIMKPNGKANQRVQGFEQNGPGALEPGPKIMKALPSWLSGEGHKTETKSMN
jgi:hypothetical protein